VTGAIEIRGLGKTFPGEDGHHLTVFDNLSLSIRGGEFVCVVGPSGCGKSTILHTIAGIATDTWGAEVRPNETEDTNQPWHWITIPIMGLTVGEIFYLADLARDCAEDKRYEFLFVAPALPVTGAVGSPVNPLAIK